MASGGSHSGTLASQCRPSLSLFGLRTNCHPETPKKEQASCQKPPKSVLDVEINNEFPDKLFPEARRLEFFCGVALVKGLFYSERKQGMKNEKKARNLVSHSVFLVPDVSSNGDSHFLRVLTWVIPIVWLFIISLVEESEWKVFSKPKNPIILSFLPKQSQAI